MRKIIVSEFLTLDGIMESPDKWSFDFSGEEQERFKFKELAESDALLLGRNTYEGFAEAWPSITDESGYADMMNNYPKYVVTSTLKETKWNNTTLIKDNIFDEITKLKQQPGKDILIFGSAELVYALTEQNLIDEYKLMIFPTTFGNGKRIFKEGCPRKALKLVKTDTFNSGVVVLSYT
ncbi:dihydrofolate reductase family protein [Salipaludibacillus sp. HK11]|uniref:dihydrofolate reductase family protein n=1 Tax=Salipaludibacillus sp. HK11 TaxID=3394320 RepID=UPI0039FD502A